MSLYWVARLPIEQSKGALQNPLKPSNERIRAPSRPTRKVRQWKIALSLAIVGALASPFVFRTYNAQPSYGVWVPLTSQEKESLAASLQKSNNCQSEADFVRSDNDFIRYYICSRDKEKFELGGEYEYHLDRLKYLTLNFGTAIAAFISVFGLALLLPMLVRGCAFLALRYWKWLNA